MKPLYKLLRLACKRVYGIDIRSEEAFAEVFQGAGVIAITLMLVIAIVAKTKSVVTTGLDVNTSTDVNTTADSIVDSLGLGPILVLVMIAVAIMGYLSYGRR